MWQIFKHEIKIYHSKAKIYVTILFGETTRFSVLEMTVEVLYGNENCTFHSGP